MEAGLFDDNSQEQGTRRFLTAALAIITVLLLLRLTGTHYGPAGLFIYRYDVLLPAGLIVLVWRLLAARSIRLSRHCATSWLLGVVAGMTVLFFWPHIDSDGDYYYAYLRSILWDGDFNLSNEAAWYAKGWMRGLHNALNWATGYIYSGASIGTPLFWLPFVAVGHLVALGLQAVGYPVVADGYDMVYRFAVSLGTWTYVLCGLFVCVRLLETWFPRVVALVATLGMFLAGPQLCYAFQSGSFSHGVSFFLTSLGLFVWIKQRERPSTSGAFRIGFLLGLASLVRPQNALWLALPLVDRILHDGLGRGWKCKVLWVMWLAGSAGVAFLPQLVLWHIERGSILSFPQGPGFVGTGRWNQWRVLFHPFHGLFIWHPLHLVALIGLIGFTRSNRALGLLLILGIGLQIWINGAVEAWYAGGAFGQRRFESSLLLFMIGLSYLLQRVCADRSLWAMVVTGLCCAVLWNFLLFAQVVEGPLYYSSPVDLTGIWSDQFSIAPARLELLVSRSPLIRWLSIALADGAWELLAAWLGLVSVLVGLAALATWVTPRLMASLLSGRRRVTYLWGAAAAVPCGLVIVVVMADVMAQDVPVAFREEGETLVMRRLALHSPERYQGGYVPFVLGPREEKRFNLQPPCDGRTLLVVGAQKEGSAPRDQPVLRIHFGSSPVDILSRFFPPVLPSAVPMSDRPSVAPVVRTEYRGLSARAPSYSYGYSVPLGPNRTIYSLALANLTTDVTLAIEGIAILPEIMQSPKTTELAIVGPRHQQEIPLADLANADYLHHVFSERDLSKWRFFPSLGEGVYESGGIRFRILPSVDETGRWSVLSILHKDDVFALPMTSGCYDGISLAWVAYGTYLRGRGRLPPEKLVSIRFKYVDGVDEHHAIVSHRDVYDWRDPYVSSDCLVYQEALYQKICRTDLSVGRPDVPLLSVVVEACWETDGVGLAMLAATAWRETGE